MENVSLDDGKGSVWKTKQPEIKIENEESYLGSLMSERPTFVGKEPSHHGLRLSVNVGDQRKKTLSSSKRPSKIKEQITSQQTLATVYAR